MASSKLALEELQKIVELFSSNQLPEVCAKAMIDSPMKPCSRWSLGNQLLMLLHGTVDARGFRQWQEVKRHVSKGAHAFYILGPVIINKKVKDEQTGEEEHEEEFLVGFKAIPVFRYEDTEGEPLPVYKPRDLPPLVDVAQKWGIKIAYEIVPREYGSFSPSLSLIQLGTEEWDTFFHELVHAAETKLGQLSNRQENESVAQLAAATLCRMYGRDSDAYSWNYIAKYAGEKSPEAVGRLCIRVLARVQKVITTILEATPSSGKTLSNNPFELAKQDTSQAPPKKREWSGFKAKLRFQSQELTGDIETRYGKVDVESVLDVEGNLEKVGPKGLPVKSNWAKHFYEEGEEISEDAIRYLQTLPDGTKIEVDELDKTNIIEIQEGRPIEECTLEDDGRKALGTTITREDVSKYAPDSVYAMWADDSGWGLLRLAEYLEKQRLALFYPFTHGRGFKTYTATVYPMRFNGDLYILWVMNSGEMILKHPIRRAEGVVKEERRVVLVAPRLKAKKAAGVA